jgi:hypothetical protein
VFLLFLLLNVCVLVTCSKISPRVAHLLAQGHTRNTRGDVNLWVYFSDKDLQGGSEEIRAQLHPNSLLRRTKVLRSGGTLVDYHDFPVNAQYISQVEASGVVLRRTSKWLNAVSIIFRYIYLFLNLDS